MANPDGGFASRSHDADLFAEERRAMVSFQIEARGVRDPEVLEAMLHIPRHIFIPKSLWSQAHEDHPLPIGLNQTISQPYIVAFMAMVLALEGKERVLEVGSGSGYMTAVLSRLAREVHGVELEPLLADRSAGVLRSLGIENVHIHCGDGSLGLEKEAPFDVILTSCAADRIPPCLLQQLAPEGRLLLPLQNRFWGQSLVKVTKHGSEWRQESLLDVVFVPMRHLSASGAGGGSLRV